MTKWIASEDGTKVVGILSMFGLFFNGDKTHFHTDPKLPLQVATIRRKVGETIPMHEHKPAPRTITATAEVLYVIRGSMEVSIEADGKIVRERLASGCLMVIFGYKHEIRFLEDSVLIEVKQGPYQDDKVIDGKL